MASYGDETIKKSQKEIKELIESGAPIVKLNIFDIIDKIKIKENMMGRIEWLQETYLELVEALKKFSQEDIELFLKGLKELDVTDNQAIEKEDAFFIALFQKFSPIHTVDLLLEKREEDITKEEFVKFHDLLLLGTSSEDKQGLRDNDLKFVGYIQDNPKTAFHYGNRAISYFPLKHTEIPTALDKIVTFYNKHRTINDKYYALIFPMICHGLIAALQLFKDGNTRYARLIQNVLMYDLLNKNLNLDLEAPIVYASRQYLPYRDEYRDLIEGIVLNNDEESWEKWFNFNINRIYDAIRYNMINLQTLKTHKRKLN